MTSDTKFITLDFNIRLTRAMRMLMDLELWQCREIIQLLAEAGDVGMHGVEIEITMSRRLERHICQPDVSRHLGILRRMDVVRYSKRGKYHVYVLNHERLAQISASLTRFSVPAAKVRHVL